MLIDVASDLPDPAGAKVALRADDMIPQGIFVLVRISITTEQSYLLRAP